MQNSKLSTIIFPKLGDSWQQFIKKVEEDLNNVALSQENGSKRINFLKDNMPRIKKIIEASKDNVSEILKYRQLFTSLDKDLSSFFDALEFFKAQDNFDNDAVMVLYKKIVESPTILRLGEEYNSLLYQKEHNSQKSLEDLISGKKIDQSLIIKLLDKYDLDEKTKKDVLLYSIVMTSIKQKEIDSSVRKEKKKKSYEETISELKSLCEDFAKAKDEYQDLYNTCYSIKQNMTPNDMDMYKGYTDYSVDTDLANKFGFDNSELLKIYALQFIEHRNNIVDYIDSLCDLQMENSKLSDEVEFLRMFIGEFKEIAKRVNRLSKENSIEKEEENEDNRVFFALTAFNTLIVDKNLIVNNRNSLNAFIRKVNTSKTHQIDGIRVVPMIGVKDVEELLGKTIFMLKASNYKLAYIMVNNCVLVLDMADANDTKFDSAFRHIIRGGILAIQRQISLIEDMNSDYIDLQKELTKDLLSENEMKK